MMASRSFLNAEQVFSYKKLVNCVLFLFLSACAGRMETSVPDVQIPPSARHDICDVFDSNPGWYEAALLAKQRWLMPISTKMAILWYESKFQSKARPQQPSIGGFSAFRISSAYGYAQALDSTWSWYRQDAGNPGARRDRFQDAIDFVGWYMKVSQVRDGIPASDAYNHYLAYHEGHAGYLRGTWRNNKTLQETAAKVQLSAQRYSQQLAQCGRTD